MSFKSICGFISNYFRVFFLGAIFVGIYMPTFSASVDPYMSVIMMLVMYLGCLKVTQSQLSQIGKQRKKVVRYLIVSMIVLPIVLYYATDFLYSERAIGVFLLVAAPAGIASIALSSIVKGNTSLVATITILSSVICIVTIPILSGVLFGSTVDIDVWNILFSLVAWIVVPFILARMTQVVYPDYEKFIYIVSPLTILLVMPVIWGPIGKNIETYKSLGREYLIYGTLALFGLSIILHVVGRLIYRNGSPADKIGGSIGMGYMNLTLALLLATKYFGASAVLVILLFELPRDLMLIPFGWISRKLNKQ